MEQKLQRYKHSLPVSYCLGATLTYELIKTAPERLTRVFISSETVDDGGIHEILSACRSQNIPIIQSDKAFHLLSPKGNCYVIGEFRKENTPLPDGNHLVLVNPSDAGNLGTILRTAAGFNLDGIAIIPPAVDVYDPRVVRASMGALFHMKVEVFPTIEDYMVRFPEHHRYAFMLRRSRPLLDAVKQEPFALIFGNEGTGLPDTYADFCEPVLIQHSTAIDSLNLPMAAGIAMFEFTKERFHGSV